MNKKAVTILTTLIMATTIGSFVFAQDLPENTEDSSTTQFQQESRLYRSRLGMPMYNMRQDGFGIRFAPELYAEIMNITVEEAIEVVKEENKPFVTLAKEAGKLEEFKELWLDKEIDHINTLLEEDRIDEERAQGLKDNVSEMIDSCTGEEDNFQYRGFRSGRGRMHGGMQGRGMNIK